MPRTASRMIMTTFYVPVRTVSEANRREHWRPRYARSKYQRSAAKMLTLTAMPGERGDVKQVKLVRFAPRELDSDNVCSALKAVRDGVADGLGINDGDKRIKWVYDQYISKDYTVEVEVRTNSPAKG